MVLDIKKTFSIAILALLIGLSAYAVADDAQSLAVLVNQTVYNITVASSFSVNASGEVQITNYTIFKAGSNVSLSQDTANHTITITANGTKGDKGDPGSSGSNGIDGINGTNGTGNNTFINQTVQLTNYNVTSILQTVSMVIN